ncbi:hypothetical protein [Pontibaca methylaminivorans]|uniref:hypothetical protein n=1 Tax=Pontibaca methylaminivorans TaxID=515897 RepID=UPI002FDA87A3
MMMARMMTRFAPAALLLSLLALAACGPVRFYNKPGTSVAQMERDQTECEVESLRDAPVATRIRREPPYFVPPRQYCNAEGRCVIRGGYWREGAVYTEDVNAPLRARLRDMCMMKRGYTPVSLPRCPASVAAAAPQGATRILPQITQNSCVIRHRDGSWQIVNVSPSPQP